MERLAIMGGTFDPIHMGHLRMAHAVQRQLEFDKVVFLPAYIPPHKQKRSDFASWQDRLAMVELAIKEYEDFVVSSLEFDRGGLSYTYDTVNVMQEMWPDADIYLIIGEDSLTQLYTRRSRRRKADQGLRVLGRRKNHPCGGSGNGHFVYRDTETAAGRETHTGHGAPCCGAVYF